VPLPFIEMKLAERFHCLPSQIRQESWEDIDLILAMLEIDNQFAERDRRLSEKKYARKR